MNTNFKGQKLIVIGILGIILTALAGVLIIKNDLFINEDSNPTATTQPSVSSEQATDVEDTTPVATTEEEQEEVVELTEKETITFASLDDLEITADLYILDDSSPIILLFHQAYYSRGEYLEIAPKLNALGYNVMAVDARSGSEINGVKNETFSRAFNQGLGNEFTDAAIDVEASIQYAKDDLGYSEIITWGSSYSATLVLALSQNYSDSVKAVLSFSPANYMLENTTLEDYVSNLLLPTFITGQKWEEYSFRSIYDDVASDDKVIFVPESIGAHGSSALWEETNDHEEYWTAVTEFLNSLE